MYRFPFSVTGKGQMKSKALVSNGAETSTCLIVGFSDSWTWFPFLAKHSVLTPCTNIRRPTRPVKSRLDFLKSFLLLCIWFMVSFLVDFERLIVKWCTYHRFCTVKEVFLTLSKVHCFKRISNSLSEVTTVGQSPEVSMMYCLSCSILRLVNINIYITTQPIWTYQFKIVWFPVSFFLL